MSLKKIHFNQSFKFENGFVLPELEIAYHSFGRLNADKSNVVWITHALTANSNPAEWWPGLVGEADYFNPDDHFIICANVLGSAYGTSGPLSNIGNSDNAYFQEFGSFTIRDIVKVHILLANHLGIEHIHNLIGGSLGGQQAVEWAITEPDRIKNLTLIATNAFHSPWGIAFNESQRLAIQSDQSFGNKHPEAGKNGLLAARSIALLSYRTSTAYNQTQAEETSDKTEAFKASSYQKYQGEKLVKRFNAYSYFLLTKAMDSHNVGRNRGSVQDALAQITANTLVVSIDSDLLFPVEEQVFLAQHIKNAKHQIIPSFYGHDGFLIETEALTSLLKQFILESAPKPNRTSSLSESITELPASGIINY